MSITYCSAQDAVKLVQSHQRVFIHGSAATPVNLVNALLERAPELEDVELVAISTFGNFNWNSEAVRKTFYLNSLFVSANVREWANSSYGDYVPVFLSEIPRLFKGGYLPIDIAMVMVSPPDAHGYCTLGTSIDAALAAVNSAKNIIAVINPNMPRTHGDGQVHVSKISAFVYEDLPLQSVDYSEKVDDISLRIGELVAGLIEDRSTLQMGIGTIPDATLRFLQHHKDLGIHTEMFSDGIIPLMEKGIITNAYKKILPGKTVTSFALGTKRLYDYLNDNPSVVFKEVSFVNDATVIRENPKVVAINSAIEIDLTGQVCSDSIGQYQYSGIGGQMDFMRGAALSAGGKPIIALPSVTNKGISRIVPQLNAGAGVVTTRGHVHYIVTEYGVVNLYGKNLEQRAALLISIAHPNHRDHLERAYFERFKKMPLNK